MSNALNLAGLDLYGQVPHLAENWFQPWAIEELAAQELIVKLQSIDLGKHLAESRAAELARVDGNKVLEQAAYRVHDGLAVIDIVGTMQKQQSSFGGTSTVAVRRAVRAAAQDSDVNAILLRIESPGGAVNGTDELAAEVRKAAAVKPVEAYIEDLGASAAYWVASQASNVWANNLAKVGSIGTYAVIHDYSAHAAQQGVKVHVIRAGAMKGAGTPGTELTSEQIANFQRLIDSTNAHFVEAVTSGRKLPPERVKQLADGRVYLGKEAVELGLADGVKTFDEVCTSLMQAGKPKTRSTKMSTDPKAATIGELKAAFPNAGSDFYLAQLERGASLEQAKDAWITHLHEQNAKLAKEKAELEAKAKADEAAKVKAEEELKAKGAKPGNPTVGAGAKAGGSESGGDAKEQWQAKIDEKMKAGLSRQQAVLAVAKANPELQAAVVAGANQGRGSRRD